jgi:hypothetical protein
MRAPEQAAFLRAVTLTLLIDAASGITRRRLSYQDNFRRPQMIQIKAPNGDRLGGPSSSAACTRVHFINPKTGKLLGRSDDGDE